MTPRQVLIEILNDYRFQIKSGMPVAQALDILRQQVVSLIEYEKTLAYDRGQEAGRYGERWELQRKYPSIVISQPSEHQDVSDNHSD